MPAFRDDSRVKRDAHFGLGWFESRPGLLEIKDRHGEEREEVGSQLEGRGRK